MAYPSTAPPPPKFGEWEAIRVCDACNKPINARKLEGNYDICYLCGAHQDGKVSVMVRKKVVTSRSRLFRFLDKWEWEYLEVRGRPLRRDAEE
jgi:hypothetical protein